MKIKKLLIFGLFSISLIGVHFVYAQETTTPPLSELSSILILLAQLLSWIWIPIANLAGKLMTNSLASGEAFHLGSFLFQCRSVVRIIANFALVAAVLKIILDVATSKAETLMGLGSKIVKLVIASLFINASWFLLGAMIDLSNLAVFGVSNIGYSLINSSPSIKRNIASQMVCVPKSVTYDHEKVTKVLNGESNKNAAAGTIDPFQCGTDIDPQKSVDWITPTYDDLSGPFTYFGYGVFRFFEYLDISTINTSDSTKGSSLSSITISFFVKLFLMAMFLTPLIALLVVNAARLFYIRVWFICAPLIALKRGLKDLKIGRLDALLNSGGSGGDDFFDVKNIIGALFTPATVTATLFLSIMVISSMFGAFVGDSNGGSSLNNPGANLGGTGGIITNSLSGIQAKTTTIQNNLVNQGIHINGTTISMGGDSVTLDGNIVSDASGRIMGSFGYLIMCIMTIGLLWATFRVGLSTSSLLSKLGNTIMTKGKRVITQGIKLPIGFEGKMVSLDQMNETILNMDKWKGIMKDNYITPEVTSQRRLVGKKKTEILRRLGIESYEPYYGSKSFNGKASDSDFGFKSQQFFRDLHDDISNTGSDNSGLIDYGNEGRKRSIQSWVDNGGIKYLIDNKLIADDKKLYIKDDKGVDTKNIDYNYLFEKDTKFGGFIDGILNSKSILNETSDKFSTIKSTGDKTFSSIKKKPDQLK